MKQILLCSLLSLCFTGVYSQKHVYVHFVPKVAGNTLVLSSVVQDLQGVEMTIEYFNYYLSNLHIIHDGSQDLDLSDTVFLIQAADYTLDLGMQNITSISQVDFGVGVPSDLNHLDIATYPAHHPLSFQTPSMHWGWTAGYSFMIVGGQGDTDNNGTPEAPFQLHNLGDASYKNVSIETIATESDSQLDVYIYCNLDEWIYGSNPGSVGIVHGSTATNIAIMNNVDNRNVFEASPTAGIETVEIEKGFIKSINSGSSVMISWTEINNAANYSMIDANGKTVETGKINNNQGDLAFTDLTPGVYVFTLYSENLDKLNQLRIVR